MKWSVTNTVRRMNVTVDQIQEILNTHNKTGR